MLNQIYVTLHINIYLYVNGTQIAPQMCNHPNSLPRWKSLLLTHVTLNRLEGKKTDRGVKAYASAKY